jgi:DNA-binding response OmpR family regulator
VRALKRKDSDARYRLVEEENDQLRERIEALSGAAQEYQAFFDLTKNESICLGVLLNNQRPRKTTFMAAIYGHKNDDDVAEEKIIDVWLCHMRKKLAKQELSIETEWGQGYYLTDETKTKLRAMLSVAA